MRALKEGKGAKGWGAAVHGCRRLTGGPDIVWMNGAVWHELLKRGIVQPRQHARPLLETANDISAAREGAVVARPPSLP